MTPSRGVAAFALLAAVACQGSEDSVQRLVEGPLMLAPWEVAPLPLESEPS